jgi:hypothetical protein
MPRLKSKSALESIHRFLSRVGKEYSCQYTDLKAHLHSAGFQIEELREGGDSNPSGQAKDSALIIRPFSYLSIASPAQARALPFPLDSETDGHLNRSSITV